MTGALRDQLQYLADLTKSGGATTVGCGDGDFSRYMRMVKAGWAGWAGDGTHLTITTAGLEALQKARNE